MGCRFGSNFTYGVSMSSMQRAMVAAVSLGTGRSDIHCY